MRAPFTKLYVHLVWATWNRRPLITADLETPLFSCIRAEAESSGCDVVAIGGVEDHIHLLVRVSTTVSVASLVQRLKGVSSHLVNRLADRPPFFKWQGGYGAFTVSAWDVRRVQLYIRGQKAHHRRETLSANLERTQP